MRKAALPPEPSLPDVPAKHIVDFDFFAVQPVDHDLYKGWKQLHDGPDAIYTARNGGHWVLTRAADIAAVFGDAERFSNAGVAMSREGREMLLAPGETDEPEHAVYRNLLNPFFGPRQVRDIEAHARHITVELIEAMRREGACEFRAAFAQRMPIYLFLSMMDLPESDATILLPAADLLTRDSDPQSFHSAMETMMHYLYGRIAERAAQPGDDFIGRLLKARPKDRPLEPTEVLSMTANVMFGGLDTVVATMGFFMDFLARHPDHRCQLLEDPSLIAAAVEELLRRHSIANFGRVATREADIAGVRIRPGDLVLLPTSLHNLDERRFADPMTVDFHRADKGHLNFGTGGHRCLGLHLARLELRVMLEEWLPRIPDFWVSEGETVQFNSGRINAVTYLPLQWRASA